MRYKYKQPIGSGPSGSKCLHSFGGIPLGSYHVPVFGYPILGFTIYSHKVGSPEKEYGMSLWVGLELEGLGTL